jgi:NHL repeat
MVLKFNPAGRIVMVIGHRPDVIAGAVASPGGPAPPAEKYTLGRPTDVAWDPQGNIFVSDGYVNHRVVKYDKNGRFLKQVGSEKTGTGPGQFNTPHSIAVDAKGMVYVADRGNNRVQVFDNDLNYKTSFTNVGTSWTVCVSPGPHQYFFTSNSNPNGNPPGSWETTGEIYKMELDGTIIGKFGHAGKLTPGFQVVHMLDCRNPNEIVVAEIESWRVQKLLLKPVTTAKTSSLR